MTKAATMAYEDGAWYKVTDEFLTSNYGHSGPELIDAATADGEPGSKLRRASTPPRIGPLRTVSTSERV